jgi:signal transduction histidine kinase
MTGSEARVWVVEDSALAQEAIRAALAGRYDVVCFDEGSSMLERLKREEAPDLLLLDWQLPELSGVEICSLVRESYDDFRLPVVILTGVRQRVDAAEALAAGANDFITKPFTPEELLARVGVQVRLRRQALDRVSQSGLEGQLLGIVSHDLRNPIGAIRLTAALMLRREPREERDVIALRRIVSASERANRLILDLLDCTQASIRGELPVRLGPADLGEIARQVAEEHRSTHPERTIELVREGDTRLEGDADRLAQLASNLISNALHHGTTERPVRVGVRGAASFVELTVVNSGEPIPPAVRAKMFKPFQRSGQSMQPGQRSIGLGLFIVDHLVRAHGGTIGVESSGGDTTFRVTLPKSPAKG